MLRLDFISVGLTLILSFLVEIVFYAVCIFFGDGNWLGQIYHGFHYLAANLVLDWILAPMTAWQSLFAVFVFISVAVLQWWLIILAVIWAIRHFRKKSA